MERIVVSAEEFDQLLAMLDEPPREIPELKALVESKTIFDN